MDPSAAGVLGQTAARRYQAAPIGFIGNGALIVAIADPTDSLGLSDIAVMTKLAVRPAVAARSQIIKLLDELEFMDEPLPAGPHTVGTLIVPPDESSSPAVSLAPVALGLAAPAAVDDGRVTKLQQGARNRPGQAGGRKDALREQREQAGAALEEARAAERANAERRTAAGRREASAERIEPSRVAQRRSRRCEPSAPRPTRRAPRRSRRRSRRSAPRRAAGPRRSKRRCGRTRRGRTDARSGRRGSACCGARQGRAAGPRLSRTR